MIVDCEHSLEHIKHSRFEAAHVGDIHCSLCGHWLTKDELWERVYDRLLVTAGAMCERDRELAPNLRNTQRRSTD